MTRVEARTLYLAQAEHSHFHAVFYGFAAQVAQQRCDVDRAAEYERLANEHHRNAKAWGRAADDCVTWWTRLSRWITGRRRPTPEVEA